MGIKTTIKKINERISLRKTLIDSEPTIRIEVTCMEDAQTR